MLKKSLYLFGLSFFVLILAKHLVSARIIGTNPTGGSADDVCFGGRVRGNTVISATESCLDFNGDWIPTAGSSTSGWNQSLGTSAFPWYSEYVLNAITEGQASNPSMQVGFPQSPFGGLLSFSTIPYNSMYEQILDSSSVAQTMTGTPTIATNTYIGGVIQFGTSIPDGSQIVLVSTAANQTIYLQDNSLLKGSAILTTTGTTACGTGGVIATMTNHTNIGFVYNAALGEWMEEFCSKTN